MKEHDLHISKDLKDNNIMHRTRCCHELTNQVDSITKIRLNDNEISNFQPTDHKQSKTKD